MPKTEIGWADHTTNFYTWNCNKVSEGCKHCYAEERSRRYPQNSAGGEFAAAPKWRAAAVDELRKTPSGTITFVNSHSDTFHEKISLDTIKTLFAHMNNRSDMIFLLLTKRPLVALQHAPYLHWSDNIWLGTSVESAKYLPRIATLKQVPAKHRFISFEPLLENLAPFQLREPLEGIDWAIVGGESGDKHRPFDKSWGQHIQMVCEELTIPFFFKQGSALFAGGDRLLNGQTYDEIPAQFTQLHKQNVKSDQLSLF